MILLDICNNLSSLGAILFINNITKILCTVTPILLLLFLTIDFAKATIESNEEKMDKVKHTAIKRIAYALIVFLVPAIVSGVMGLLGNKTSISACYELATPTNVSKLADAKKLEDKIKKEQNSETKQTLQKKRDELYNTIENKKKKDVKESNNNSDNKTAADTYHIYQKGNMTGSEAIATTAEALSWPEGTKTKKTLFTYNGQRVKSWSDLKKGKPTKAFMIAYDKVRKDHFKVSRKATRVGATCDGFAGTVVKYSGYDKIGFGLGEQIPILRKSEKWEKVDKAKRGDLCIEQQGHIKIYLGKGKMSQASLEDWFGRITEEKCKRSDDVWRATK